MAEKIRKTVSKGVAKVPIAMQLEALECGAACLTMILSYYGKWIPIEKVRVDCGVSRDGSNAVNIMKAARHYGLSAKGCRFEPETLKKRGKFPCIVHWNFNHFVVLCGFKGGKVYINDPAKGSCVISMKEFDEAFTGVCLMFEPSEDFVPSGKRKSMLRFAARRIKGAETAAAFTTLVCIVTSLIGIINPAFSRVLVDKLLTGSNPEWVLPFFVLLGIFALIQVVLTAINGIYSLRINGKMAAVGSTSYMWKILRLPTHFFEQRMAGDIVGRKEANADIANTLINSLAPLVVRLCMLVLYLVIMIRYSAILAAIGITSIIINAAVSRYISKKRINLARLKIRDSAKLAGTTVAGIEMIETIKASGAENAFFSKWAGYQASKNSQDVKYDTVDLHLGIIPAAISAIADLAVLIIGVYMTIQGNFTIGMVMIFQGYLASFLEPAQTIINAGQTIQEMRTDMEMVDDVMDYPADDVFSDGELSDSEEYSKLGGDIEIRNVTFGYSPLAEPLIKELSIKFERGTSTAIVGGSGCGKSTVSKLLSGLNKPWTGEILFDGKPLSAIDKSVFFGSVAVVDQDIILFEDTIANNIKMWNTTIEDFEMIMSANDALLHNDIIARDGGYNHRLTEGGKNLSGGQRQRMEIARVLAGDPTVIILDEATSALDSKTEHKIVNSIRERGITSIVIAHRLSTVRSCDRIIVLDNGGIIADGTHDELMESCELYRELVIND